ncbi:helix-turn-helix domain-containing protein [Actinokineospora pegani]|uniref:helix-turn-helix domain-containing protein n=1 Tax=Actinokineospora pegani TaxID=2654637 RepID=UPI0012E9EE7A|nr:helix-turn-helix domain-containing protein [Actinokineospora pegani]
MSADTGSPAPPPSARATLRKQIQAAVRGARQAKDLTQAELGKRLGVSRFVVNRIEAGATDLTPAIAEQLEAELGLAELRTLVADRDRLVPVADTGRDAVVGRVLGRRGLRRVRVVLADTLDLRSLVATWADGDLALVAHDVSIVVPTARRERELFGEQDSLHGHIEYQLKRVSDLKKSHHYAAGSLHLYESDLVIAPMVLAETRTGVESAVWAPVTLSDSSALPVGTSVDRAVFAGLSAHFDTLVTGEELLSNEALCHVEAGPGGRGPVFTRYFTVGEDQEEDVDEREGQATALVLVVALCPRASHGVARRVITYRRLHSRLDRQPSFFSNTVTDVDVRRAKDLAEGAPGDGQRSTRSALASALDINPYLARTGGTLPDLAFQLAARREMSMFGLDISPERFTPVEVPEELWLVGKGPVAGRRRAALAPRLFVLELEDRGGVPELAALQARADIDPHGVRDYVDEPDLNDFLVQARDMGWLERWFRELGIAER